MKRLVGFVWSTELTLLLKNHYDTALFWKLGVSKLVNELMSGEAVVQGRLIA